MRLWADWPSVQRDRRSSRPATASGCRASLAALDAPDRSRARRRHADHPGPLPLSALGERDRISSQRRCSDSEFFPWDRVARLAQYIDWRAGLRTRPGTRTCEYRMPPDGIGPAAAWARCVGWLWDRYAGPRSRPRSRSSTSPTFNSGRSAARSTRPTSRPSGAPAGTTLLTGPRSREMMVTVDALARSTRTRRCCSPPRGRTATVGSRARSRSRTPIAHTASDGSVRGVAAGRARAARLRRRRPVDLVLPQLLRRRAPLLHVVDLRQVLVEGGWNGRQLDGGPEVWCTEGGCRLAATNTRFGHALGHTFDRRERKHYQALVLTEALSRHHYAKGAGAGHRDVHAVHDLRRPGFDDGILPDGDGGAPRPSLDGLVRRARVSTPRRSSAPPGARSSSPRSAAPGSSRRERMPSLA